MCKQILSPMTEVEVSISAFLLILLALAKHSDLNAPMALFDSKPDDGIDGKTRQGKLWAHQVTTRLVVSYNKMDLAA